MNRQAAQDCVNKRLQSLKRTSYAELTRLIDHPVSEFMTGVDGKQYQLEVEVFWDGSPGGDLRVMVAADRGVLSAFVPLTDSIVVVADGKIR